MSEPSDSTKATDTAIPSLPPTQEEPTKKESSGIQYVHTPESRKKFIELFGLL